MAGGVNKVILVGNLGADPDMRHTPSGAGVCELRVATNESWTDKSGQKQERTEWHRIVVWGKRAEVCSKYLSKGRQVYIEGRLRTRNWEDKEGNKRYTTEIIANDVQFLGGGGGGGRGGADGPPPQRSLTTWVAAAAASVVVAARTTTSRSSVFVVRLVLG